MAKPPGVVSGRDLALWARKRGLLSVYLSVRPLSPLTPAAWQVIRPGYQTDPSAPKRDRGHKTFTYDSVDEKNRAETRARAWAANEYEIFDWRRIQGFGTSLFPVSVVEELTRLHPETESYRQRQSVESTYVRAKDRKYKYQRLTQRK